jgi:hypothetical protein
MLDFSRGKKVYFIVDLCICEYIEHDYIVIIGSSISFFLLIIIL